jgi:hypothetical protein
MISKIQENESKDFMREYVEVLNNVLFNVVVTLPITSRIPILISTLGEKVFQLVGLFIVNICQHKPCSLTKLSLPSVLLLKQISTPWLPTEISFRYDDQAQGSHHRVHGKRLLIEKSHKSIINNPGCYSLSCYFEF